MRRGDVKPGQRIEVMMAEPQRAWPMDCYHEPLPGTVMAYPDSEQRIEVLLDGERVPTNFYASQLALANRPTDLVGKGAL